MSTQKKNTQKKGFTLVEVIVVAVIVAILAAVAIPIYQQYVTDSRNNAAQNAGGSIASFAGACRTSGGTVTIAASTATTSGSASCSANTSTSIIPANITITNTAPTATTAGVITAYHTIIGSGTSYTYNY